MSYILEALKKSEQERTIGQVPDLAALQETAPSHSARWPWILSIALLVNALALALFAWKPWESHARNTPPPAHMAGAPVEPAMPPQVVEMAPKQPASAPGPVEIPAEPTREPQVMAQSLQHRDAPLVPVRTPEAGAVEWVETPEADSPGDDIPRWEDLSAEQRSRMPTPRLDVHVFAQEPARRFVMVDLQKYQEGDQLPQGVTLVAIRAEGIVLSYQGQQYRVERP